jgi:hypothetical protein
MTDAIRAQRELSEEIDAETAKIIREEGIPLFEAVEIAKQRVRRRRASKRQYLGKPDNGMVLLRSPFGGSVGR